MTPEERKVYDKIYREKNKDKMKEHKKEYNKKNKEKIKEKSKEYRKTDAGIKTHRIGNWKTYGVKSDDYSSLYEHYINCNKCEICSIDLVEGRYGANRRCLDHDHTTGLFRNVLCNSCNVKRG